MPYRLGLLLALVPSAAVAAPPDFDRQVAPVLAARCLDCHHGPKPKGKLDLSRKAGALAGEAPAIVPGKPDESELWIRVASGEMPPRKPLPETERKLLHDWIAAGAKWGADPIDPFRFTNATRAGYDWWSLQPVKRPPVPKLRAEYPAPVTAIDAFVFAKLRDKGLSPSPPADRRTLIRRVYSDLIGLPPSPEEVAAFLADSSPNAYEKVVEKLLASPHYGERWARHWLDVVRYGETDGFERNTARTNAWPYRDWVIRALNADMPYDEFARLQLAGDVLRPNDPDAIKATGFLVAGVHNTVLGNDQMRAVARQDELEDLVGSVGQTFLGLTANCARCHDHKFDPLSQADFYRLAAALAGTGHGERAVIEQTKQAEAARLSAELTAATAALGQIENPARQAVLADRSKGRPARVGPQPLAAWDFRSNANDGSGTLHAKLVDGAKLSAGGAMVNGKAGFFRTVPLTADLRAKTLEAWVRLDNLSQRGGGVITVQTPGGSEFDSIVFGEREPGRWMAGSDFFRRTQPFHGPEEVEASGRAVHVAITYSDDGTITAYRDGKPYGRPYRTKGPITFKAGSAVVLFGCRHEPAAASKLLAGTVAAARLYDRALLPKEVAASFTSGPGLVSETELEGKLSPVQKARRAELQADRKRLSAALAGLGGRGNQTVYANIVGAPGVTRLLLRGDVATPGEAIAPAGLRAVQGVSPDFQLQPDAPDAMRRKKLAEWITAPGNPLFARVIANRVWHYHFGTGIVETPNDLGFNGGRPTHPELLDWLAAELVEPTWRPVDRQATRSWSLKHLHRLIVTSATYRQASAPRKDGLAADAGSRLLWRMKPQRLEGEAVRDSMLAVAGLLNRTVGGKGFTDYRVRDFNGTAYYDPIDPIGPEFHRRSIYRFIPRGGNRGLLDTFDCPDPAAAAPRRAVTTTPLQALALWNSGFALRMSAAFAERVAKEVPAGVAKQVARAWQLAYQRDPTAEEAKLAAKLVTDHGLQAICRALFNSNEFLTVE